MLFSCTSAKRLRPHFREHDGVVGVNVKRHCPRSPPLARSMQYLTRRNLLWASHIRKALSEDCRSRQKNIGSLTRGTTGFSCVGVSRLDWRALLSPLPSILSILLILSKTSLCVSAREYSRPAFCIARFFTDFLHAGTGGAPSPCRALNNPHPSTHHFFHFGVTFTLKKRSVSERTAQSRRLREPRMV